MGVEKVGENREQSKIWSSFILSSSFGATLNFQIEDLCLDSVLAMGTEWIFVKNVQQSKILSSFVVYSPIGITQDIQFEDQSLL